MEGFWRRFCIYIFILLILIGSLMVDGMTTTSVYLQRFGGFGGKWKYLTHLNMWLQAIYWLIVVLAGLSTFSYESKDRKGRLHSIVDYTHSSLAFPAGMWTFWLIYAIDRELVYPKRLDEIIPQWLNHVMHTAHAPFLLLDKYFTRHKYPTQRVGMGILIFFAAMYNMWVLYLALEKDIWVYPILAVMNWPFRVVFFALLWGFFLLLYRTGQLITTKIWVRELRQIRDAARKSN